MPGPRIDDSQLFAHFVTFSCKRRRRLLDSDRAKQIVLGVLNSELSKHSARCIGFVIMPDHVHAVIWFPQPGQLSEFMQQWKQRSAFALKQLYRTHFPEYARWTENDSVWQARYYAFHIYSRAKLEEKLNYMHMNPVRASLVQTPGEWKWSSARWYAERKSVGVPIRWVECD
ncbi:MAG: transposase [Planctomycetaceae bacterium]